jgi:predicted MFS family arabinose efflux permease
MMTAVSPLRAWAAVASVAVGAFAFVTTEYLPVGLMPQIAHELGVSDGTAGLMVTTPGLISAFSAPLMMLAAGRINRRAILLALTVLLLASNLVSALAPDFATMLLGHALLGFCLGGFWTVALAAAGRLVQEQQAAKAAATIFAGITVATVVGVPLGTFIGGLWSWRVSFLAIGGLAAVALAAQILLLPSLPAQAAVRLRDMAALLRRPNPRKSIAMVALVFGAHFVAYTYVAPFMVRNASFGLGAVTPVLLGFGIAGFVSNFLASSTITRYLQASLLSAVLLCTACLAVLPLVQGSPAAVVAAVLLWGIAYGAIPLCLSVWMQQSSPAAPEAGSALFVSAVQLSIAMGSFSGGMAADAWGLSATMWLGCLLAFAGLVVIASFGWRHATGLATVLGTR